MRPCIPARECKATSSIRTPRSFARACPRLAHELDLATIDGVVALFTGNSAVRSPFVRTYRMMHADKFHLAKLRDHLRADGVGRVTFIKRGSRIDTEEVSAKLKLRGDRHRTIMLARLAGGETMLIGERATESV